MIRKTKLEENLKLFCCSSLTDSAGYYSNISNADIVDHVHTHICLWCKIDVYPKMAAKFWIQH